MGRPLSLRLYTPAQRKIILTKVFQCEAEFIRARFTAIGSIYHRSEDNTFYVGPMGPAVRRPLNHTVDRGPWRSTRDWLRAYVKSDLARIQGDPEEYRKVRSQYRLDNGNPPFAYHVAWLETLLAVIDKLQFLDTIPAAVERPVLHHPDLSGGNILVSYADATDLVSVIDFEGASVLPLWSAMDVPECSDLDDEKETEAIQKLRFEILCEADPACAQVEFYRKPLRTLRWLVWGGLTMWGSIDGLHEEYQEMKDAWPVKEPAFSALDELVALGPAGYNKPFTVGNV